MPSLGYVIVYVPDVAAAVGFYADAFGLEQGFADEEGRYAEMKTGATILSFAAESLATDHHLPVVPNRPDAPAAGIEIALVDPDVKALYGRAVAAGANPVEAPTERPWGQTVAYVRDLNGVLVELASPMG